MIPANEMVSDPTSNFRQSGIVFSSFFALTQLLFQNKGTSEAEMIRRSTEARRPADAGAFDQVFKSNGLHLFLF